MNRALALLALMTAGCASTQPPPVIEYRTQVVDTSCTTFRKITGHPSDLTTMSDDIKKQVLAHNKAWDKACSKP